VVVVVLCTLIFAEVRFGESDDFGERLLGGAGALGLTRRVGMIWGKGPDGDGVEMSQNAYYSVFIG
jgi:hypothetical protein